MTDLKNYLKKEQYRIWMLTLSSFVVYFAALLTFVDEQDRLSDECCKLSASLCGIFILIAFLLQQQKEKKNGK